jgi:cell division protein FtsB
MKRLRLGARVAGRLFVVLVAAALFAVVGLQYARVIGQNIALARSLHAVQAEVAALEAKRAAQEREIRRLSDPLGAMPEIHDRLHLVGRHQAIIYLEGSPTDESRK